MDGAVNLQAVAKTLRERADALVPVLTERVKETEALRRIPDDSIAALREAELLKVAVPAAYGGYEVEFDVVIDLIRRLGRGCGSTAWVFGIYCDHAITMGMMPKQAQDDIWANNPGALVSSGIAPSGKAERAPGGFRLTGRWQFSSGCDHADWVFVHSLVPAEEEGGRPTPCYFLLPKSDYAIEDTWFVTGLKGTGSKDILIDDVFVPAHRVQALSHFNEGTGPGGEVNAGTLYRLPRTGSVPFTLSAPAVGILDAMIDAFIERTGGRATRGFRHAELTTIQMRLAESCAERDCARMLLERATRETVASMNAEGRLSREQRARNRRDMAYVSMLCTRAADRLIHVVGASGVYEGSPIGRMHADIRAINAHHVHAFDIAGPTFAQITFGLEPTNPSF